jgi:hypothetical protein
MKSNPKPEPTPQEKFTAALASVLAVSPEELREQELAAKDEQPSPHTRYKYDPAKADS